MLGSESQAQQAQLMSSMSHDQDKDPEDDHHHHQEIIPRAPMISTSISSSSNASTSTSSSSSTAFHMRQLLVSCANSISHSDFSAAHRLLSILSSNSSPYGDSTERLVHQFVGALSIRLDHHHAIANPTSSSISTTAGTTSSSAAFIHNHLLLGNPPRGGTSYSINNNNKMMTMTTTTRSSSSSCDEWESCYLSLNQITPFLRFSHLTANQAILEAIQVEQTAIHIIDFDIMHGVQWAPLMQALAERSSNTLHSRPPTLRITGTGHDLNILQRTGDRLLKFAQSLGISFQFHPLLLGLNNDDPASYVLSAITLLPDEALAVNCVLYLHRFLNKDGDGSRQLLLFLHKIKSLNPKVVTVAEREANHNHPLFLHRFLEALDHYAALFDSLEATLPPNSRERLAVEQLWFGREIRDIVAGEGEERRERHQRFENWERMLTSAGFSNIPLSPFAVSQAKLLLRLHYPSEGYQLQFLNNSFFNLGWQNRSLFSVSSWH